LVFDATTRMTRVLSYQMKMPFRAASEYHLAALEDQPAKLILLPSAHNFDEQAWTKLVDIVQRTGATLLATGPISIDAYWKQTPRLINELGAAELQNVQREEMLGLQGAALPVSFDKRRIAEVVKEVRTGRLGAGTESASSSDAVVDIPLGKGRLIWSPLPVELNERLDTVARLYRYAIDAAGCESGLEWLQGGDIAGVYGRKLRFKNGFLYVFVSEFAWNVNVKVKDTDSKASYAFTLEKERSVLFAADAQGNLISVYRPEEVHIERS